jgi:hypothetical protein
MELQKGAASIADPEGIIHVRLNAEATPSSFVMQLKDAHTSDFQRSRSHSAP